ncbi:putative C-S lyase [Oleiagrimonas sp. C23AA]|nr:putative C-S lyase [Oleiagrimonas sp. C23AA]
MTFDFHTLIDRRQHPSVKWQRYPDDVLPLWVADMDFASPPAVIEALKARLAHGVFGYGNRWSELEHTLVEWSGMHYGWAIEPEWQCWLPGAVPALHIAALAFAEAGEGVLTPRPIYPPFLATPGHLGRQLQTFELAEPGGSDGQWRLDLERLEAAIEPNTRVLLWCHPHNPTGRVWRADELCGLAELVQKHDLVVVSDELHCDLVLDPQRPHQPLGALCPQLAERLITLWAPSKTFNVAGLSTACAVIEDRTLRQRFLAKVEGLLPHVNVLGIAAAQAAYAHGEPWRQALLQVLRDNLALLEQHVAHWPGVHLVSPQATYLAWLDFRQSALAGDPYRRLLKQARVALSPGPDYGREGFARLNFGTPTAALAEALQRMDGVLGE